MTSTSQNVYLVEPHDRNFMNLAILANLKESGLHIPHYETFNALEAAGVPPTSIEVLITLGCSRALMQRVPHLKAIINPYTGSEHIDRAAANELGIIIGNGQTEENYTGMAEATILLLLACLYDLHDGERTLRESLPRQRVSARLLRGKTVGIISHGQIARAVAERLGNWGVELLVAAPRLHGPLPPQGRHVPIEELLTASDAVLVLCSLNETTRNLLSRERLALMKPSAVLVNTARGGIVDEDAVSDMLRERRLRRVALDAFKVEPLPADSPLRTAPNAILTPHMIGHTVEAESSMARAAADSVRRVLRGQPPVHIFNPEVLPSWRGRRP